MLFKNEVYQIINAAMEVSNTLGCGFLEAVYHEALEIEFRSRKIPYESEKAIVVRYKGTELKKSYIADFLSYDNIVVELKAIKNLTVIDEAQILNYLKASGQALGLLINFGNSRLEWKRYANTKE